jgi:hypothetical protein
MPENEIHREGENMMLYLQNRWKLSDNKLIYYGMRKKPYLLHNEIKLSPKVQKIVTGIINGEDIGDTKPIKDLIVRGVIVSKEELRKTPGSLEEATFCTSCCANDFMIPGLEFDENGQCPMCATKDETRDLKSVIPIMNDLPKTEKSRFDVAVFYTGGKDSSFLLYYLAKVKKLRVLALTWEIPYMSDSARQSLENAKQKLDNVEFVIRKISNDDLRKIYRKLYELNDNTCACPSLAYVLFYPLLVEEKVPYFVLGNEPVQLRNLYYNRMAPKISYTFADNRFLNNVFNLQRILTLRKPFKKGQFHTLTMMKQLAYGNSFLKKVTGYENQFLSNVITAIHEADSITAPLKKAIRRSSATGNIPAFVHIDFNEICGGVYEWKNVKDLITREIGWVGPVDIDKGLHTSCKIEKCKEHTQFMRFYKMKSPVIPFSAIELSLATRDHNITLEQAKKEMKNSLGFTLEEPGECSIMKDYLENKREL